MKLRAACVLVGFLSLALSLVPLMFAQTATESTSAVNDAPPQSNVAPTLSGGGTKGYVPLWLRPGKGLGNSKVFQTEGKIVVGTTTPPAALDLPEVLNHLKSELEDGTAREQQMETEEIAAEQSDRITGPIDSSQRITLPGHIHHKALPQYDLGRIEPSFQFGYVTMLFTPSAAQSQALDRFLAEQLNPSSANFHKWLTPEQFADRFGLTANDMRKVTDWLTSQGLQIVTVARGRQFVVIGGSAAQIESAFQTEIHRYNVEGEMHFANATMPSIPAALFGIVGGFRGLNDFRLKPSIKRHPDFTGSGFPTHFLAPGDLYTIYDIGALQSAGFTGTGQKIAILGQTDLLTADITDYRSAFGLPAINLQQVLVPNTGDPGVGVSGDLVESDLDLEVSGSIAPNATIIFVYAGFTGGGMGVESATMHAIDNVLAPVISVSYGNCELYSTDSTIGSLPTQDLLYKQAAASGISFFASSGDDGPATCDVNDTSAPNVTSAILGLAVDYPASSWYVTGVGGTEFNEGGGTYWNTGNTGNGGSAKSYIPEKSWNDFPILGILDGGGGGPSNCFNQDPTFTMCLSGNAKPSWQTGLGVPADGVRDVPDVSLSASNVNDPYIVCTPLEVLNYPNDAGDTTSSCASGIISALDQGSAFGGTSAAAPLMAGITVLLNQYLNGSSTAGLGNVNPMLYSLATSSPSAFHDTLAGSNSTVSCEDGTPTGQPPSFSASLCPSTGPTAGTFGFDTTTGYDVVTGLGSVDANKLAVAWAAATRTATTTLVSASPTNITQGTSVTLTATVSPSTATGTVSFYNNGSATALGSGTLSTGTATFATTALPGGTDSVTATYNGDSNDAVSVSATPAVVTVTAPFTMSASPLSPSSVPAGQTATSTITITPASGFTGSVTFTNSTSSNPGSCTAGLPAGALCRFSQGSVTLNGSTPSTVTLTITTAPNMAPSAGAVTVTGTSGSTVVTTTVNLTVTATTETFTLTTNAATFPVAMGASASVPITVVSSTGFIVGSGVGATTALPLTYSCSGSPALAAAEISCQISPGGNQPTNATAVTVTLVTTAPTPAGTYTVTIGATTGGANPVVNSNAPFTIQLVVTAAGGGGFNLGASPTSASVNPGSSAAYTISVTPQNGFNSAVSLTCSVPSNEKLGCSFNSTSIVPGTTSTLTVTTTAQSAAGAFPRQNKLLPMYAVWLLPFAITFASFGLRSRRRGFGLMCFLATTAMVLLVGCGGGSSSSSGGGGGSGGGSGTPAGTYTVTVTGTAGSTQQTTTVTLTVDTGVGSAGIAGSYEFTAMSSTTSGSTTLIETNLTANGAQSNASGSNQVQTATYLNGLWYVNGACPSSSPGQNSILGTVNGSNIMLTFNEGGNVFTGQGTVSGTTISGTYSGTSPNCSDSGTFTGTQVPSLGGTFSGTLYFPSGADQVTATLTEGNNYSLTAQTTLVGADNGTYTFSGSAVANVMFVSGSVNGNPFSLFGYFDSTGKYTGTPNSIQVFDDNLVNGVYANYGLLVKQ